jgi:bacillolysin
MKKLALFFLLATFSNLLFAQTGFNTKKQVGSNNKQPISGNLRIIDGSKNTNIYSIQPLQINEVSRMKVVRDEEGNVIYIENLSKAQASSKLKTTAEAISRSFLETTKNQLRVKNPSAEFKIKSTETDANGITHLRMQQSFNGVPIYGAEMVAHLKDGSVKTMNGKSFSTPTISTKPSLSEKEALEISLKNLSQTSVIQAGGLTGKLLNMQRNEVALFIYHKEKQAHLTYELVVRPNLLERWIYYVDAHSGEILDKINHTCTLDGVFKTKAQDLNGKTQEFAIYEKDGTYFLIDPTLSMYNKTKSQLPDKPAGVVWTIDALNSKIGDESMQFSHVKSTDGVSWNKTAVSAHTNANICYNYYVNTHKRNSLNGEGGNIVSVINIADEDGKGMDNAFWNGEFMGYGNGRDGFKPLAGSLDVAGHEMTHGVIENTARLEYRNQSGALNESFADIFGIMIDRDDWTLGEDVVKPSVFPSGALRSLQNPNQGGTRDPGYQPKNMSQYKYLKDTPAEDNGGVHINSGIPNHAFYLFATNTNVGKDKAEKVYYDVLKNYLSRTSKFLDLRLAVIQSSKTLYGDVVANAARSAFDAVGIVEASSGGATPPKEEEVILPVNTGTASIIAFDPNDQSLYGGATNADLPKIASNLGCLAKPSVTDNGAFAYFVGRNNTIYRIDLVNKTAPVAIQLVEGFKWRNVAISKDGKRLAALNADPDQYIYVFNFEGSNGVRFKLSNPTYTQGVETGEVLYADSFEWDYSGENIIYDAFNEVKSLFGSYEYWDVGVLKAWNFAQKDYGDGSIEKIFTGIEEGDNIGNPAIAKTNPNCMAFDYYDSINDEHSIVAINLEEGAINLITENNDIAYPDYTIDDKVMTFNALNGSTSIIKGISLNNDKVSVSESATSQTLFTDGKWATWFAQGNRALPTKNAQTVTFNAIADQNPKSTVKLTASASSGLPIQFAVASGDATLQSNNLVLGSIPGKVTVQAIQIGNNQFASVINEQTFCIKPPAPRLDFTGTKMTASGGTLFQLYINDKPIGGQTTNVNFPLDFSGNYNVRAITTDGCPSDISNTVIYQLKVLSNEPTLNNEVTIFPNPVQETLHFSILPSIQVTNIECLDINGKIVKQQPPQATSMNVKSLSAGTYLLKVTDKKGSIYTKRFIKE